ncbi:hypothetical protein OROGR_029701 [Orobanche gracilis]
MATKVLEIVNIPDNDGDDEISVIYATSSSSVKKGATQSDAISVEDHHPFKLKRVIDLTRNSYFDDDDVKILRFVPETRKRVFKGECSNSKSANNIKLSVPSTFMCEICTDEKPKIDFFRILGCDHSYCTDCMTKYVASKLQENITAIDCPASGCKGFLEPQHCSSILPKQVFDRWGDALCEAVILASQKFYCPFKDCSALLVDDTREKNEFIVQSECPDCNRLFCVQCKVPWHSGLTCAEFQKLGKDERSTEDVMLVNLAKGKKWMRCPMCKIYVERSSGCLFMKCRCGHCFCYNCGAPLVDHYCRKCKH